MPTVWDGIVFGALQGLTEFLPVSSSGHLLLLHELLGDSAEQTLEFDVALHIGTLAALLVFFWPDLRSLARRIFRPAGDAGAARRLARTIIIATIPAVLAGLFLESWIEQVRSVPVTVGALVIVAFFFLYVERGRPQNRDLGTISGPAALGIGLAQALALIPGVSRSGITIAAGMKANLERDQAARFAFLISIPVIAGAATKKVYDLSANASPFTEWAAFVAGMASSAAVGYVVIRVFMAFLSRHTLRPFAYYRLALAALMALVFWLR